VHEHDGLNNERIVKVESEKRSWYPNETLDRLETLSKLHQKKELVRLMKKMPVCHVVKT
jgi:hypothetical protein